MLKKKMISIGKFARKSKSSSQGSNLEALLEVEGDDDASMTSSNSSISTTPSGFFAVYVGDDKERFVVPTSFLSHPLFKILLEKAYDEFGFRHTNGLVLPCSVSTFREVVDAVERCHGRFDVGKLLQEFV